MAGSDSSDIWVTRRGSQRGAPDHTLVWVRGEQDLATKVSLAVAIARAGQLDDAPVLIDLAGVTFMDASTIGAIVGGRNRLRERGRSVELRAPSPRALRVLELCGLTGLLYREPVHAATALGTWVDVAPVAVERTRGAAFAPARQPVDADRGSA